MLLTRKLIKVQGHNYVYGITIGIAAYGTPFVLAIMLSSLFHLGFNTFSAKQDAAYVGLVINLLSIPAVVYGANRKSAPLCAAVGAFAGLSSGLLAYLSV